MEKYFGTFWDHVVACLAHVGALVKPQMLQEPSPRDPKISTENKTQLCLDLFPISTDQEAEVGALPKPPEADRPSSRTGCGSGSGYTAGSGTDEHDTKFGCESDAGGCNCAGGARIDALPPLQDSVVLAVGETGLQMVMEAVDWGELIGTKVDGGEHRERWADVVGGTSIDDCSTACDDLPELCGGSEDASDEKFVRAEVAEDDNDSIGWAPVLVGEDANDSIGGVRKGRGRKSKATKRKQAMQDSEAKAKIKNVEIKAKIKQVEADLAIAQAALRGWACG